MFGLLLIIGIALGALFYSQSTASIVSDKNIQFGGKLDKLWEIAQAALGEKKYLRAEKALLTILQLDKKNATAYNRLGILYAKQRALDDAIECFEIAQSLEPSASSLHNVGLIYYETKRFDKSVLAFEQALEMDDTAPSRFIAYAKALEKTGNMKKSVLALEQAVKLERSAQALLILADAYSKVDRIQESNALKLEAKTMLNAKPAPNRKITSVRKQKNRARESKNIQM